MATQNPFRLEIPSNIPNGTTLICQSKLDDIDHPIYGKASGLIANIPLLLPKESYKISNFYELSWEAQNAVIEKTANTVKTICENLDEEESRKKAIEYILTSTLATPHVDSESKLFQSLIKISAFAWLVDDVLDDENGGADSVTTKLIYKRYTAWQDIWTTGKYENLTELAKIFPGLSSHMESLITTIREIEQEVDGVRHNVKYFIKNVFLLLQVFPIRRNGSKKTNLSEDGYRIVRGIDVGMDYVIDLSILIANIQLPDKVRECLLFKLLIDAMRVVAAIVNDLLGIGRDSQMGETDANVILRQIVYEKIPFSIAFNTELKRVQNMLNDIQFICNELVDTFPDISDVARFANLCKELHDGHIFLYVVYAQSKLRYGQIHYEIVAS